LATFPYPVSSRVFPEVIREFVSAIQSENIFPTTETPDEMESFCCDFRFQSLHSRISKFRNSVSRGVYADTEARNSITSLGMLLHQQSLQLSCAQQQIARLENRVNELERKQKESCEDEFTKIPCNISLLRIGATLSSTWTFLYQGTRDGFAAKDFHPMCDRRLRTLTVIVNRKTLLR
jgi:hypothetical protein